MCPSLAPRRPYEAGGQKPAGLLPGCWIFILWSFSVKLGWFYTFCKDVQTSLKHKSNAEPWERNSVPHAQAQGLISLRRPDRRFSLSVDLQTRSYRVQSCRATILQLSDASLPQHTWSTWLNSLMHLIYLCRGLGRRHSCDSGVLEMGCIWRCRISSSPGLGFLFFIFSGIISQKMTKTETMQPTAAWSVSRNVNNLFDRVTVLTQKTMIWIVLPLHKFD